MFINSSVRVSSKELLEKYFLKFGYTAPEAIEKIENECYGLGELEYYSAAIYRIIKHLNPDLILKIINGDSVLQLQSKELYYSANKELYKQIEIKYNQKIEKNTSKRYTCFNCGNKEVTFLEYQGRAGDEAPTFKKVCTVCDNKF